MRIGYGYDIHRLVKGRTLFLGGIEIPHPRGLLGHSDADVLLHAICDGLLGAAGCGDIGEHFPDTDPKFKNAKSTRLLSQTAEMIRKKGYAIGNIDCIIFCEEVKVTPYKQRMKKKICALLNIDPAVLNIKAKTGEGLGAVGQKKAIAASSVVLVNEMKKRKTKKGSVDYD